MTRDEELAWFRQEHTTLRKRVADPEAKMKVSQERQAKHSHNSGLPSSSDRFSRRPKSLRKRSGKKPGGQPGHSGHALLQTQIPALVVLHCSGQWAYCQCDLRDQLATIAEHRQGSNLPLIWPVITEHRVEEKRCPHCLYLMLVAFPDGVCAPIQYGPIVQALALYLVHYQLAPDERANQVLSDSPRFLDPPDRVRFLHVF